MYIDMATKCITITVDAYEKLASLKDSRDSFSDVINRLTAKGSLLELVGVLSNEEAKKLKEHRNELNKRIRKRMEKTAKAIQ